MRNEAQRRMDAPVSKGVTKAARTLARWHNSDAVESGHIWLVDLHTGKREEFVATYAANQITEESELYGDYALLRISHGKLTQAEAQRFLNEKGKGW